MSDRKIVVCVLCKKNPVRRGHDTAGHCPRCYQKYVAAAPPPVPLRRRRN